MKEEHLCPEGQWYAYQVGGITLSCDNSQSCTCLPVSDLPPYHPPCSPGSPGPAHCVDFGKILGYRSVSDDPRLKQSPLTHSDALINIADSKQCADFITTNYTYSSAGNVVCWEFMDLVTEPITAPMEAIPWVGNAVKEKFLYDLWNLGQWGNACTDFLNNDVGRWMGGKPWPSFTPEQQCTLKNKIQDWCEHLPVISPSPRDDCSGTHPPSPPPPPSPVPPTPCDLPMNVCVANADVLGRCDIDYTCHPLREGCEDSSLRAGVPCTAGEVLGACSFGGGECNSLDAPLCSSLRGLVLAPKGCEELPYYWQESSFPTRKACAPIKDQAVSWQCRLESPNCPQGTVECYWDGNWS